MVGWHHRLDGHESEQAPGVGDGQGGLACCGPRGRKESDTAEPLNNSKTLLLYLCFKWFRFQSWSKLHFSTQTPGAEVAVRTKLQLSRSPWPWACQASPGPPPLTSVSGRWEARPALVKTDCGHCTRLGKLCECNFRGTGRGTPHIQAPSLFPLYLQEAQSPTTPGL